MYYEQLGNIDDEALKRVGLDAKQLLWHYMYQVPEVDSDNASDVF